MSNATITLLRDDVPRPAELVWEEPPATHGRPGKYAAIAAALKARPGQWAVLRTYPAHESKRGWGFAGAIRDGKLIDFRDGFEALARTVDGQVRVYVRYAAQAPSVVAS